MGWLRYKLTFPCSNIREIMWCQGLACTVLLLIMSTNYCVGLYLARLTCILSSLYINSDEIWVHRRHRQQRYYHTHKNHACTTRYNIQNSLCILYTLKREQWRAIKNTSRFGTIMDEISNRPRHILWECKTPIWH